MRLSSLSIYYVDKDNGLHCNLHTEAGIVSCIMGENSVKALSHSIIVELPQTALTSTQIAEFSDLFDLTEITIY